MADIADGYDLYYAEKLWSLLPAIYRVMDPSTPDATTGPLRELTNRIGAQMAVLRRSIDRMWQDQSIETCDDWAIPYIAALVGGKLPATGQRRALAGTIHDRRRKGTLPALEASTFAATGWDSKVVELFRRLGRTRHGLDPALGWPLRKKDSGGGASLLVASGLLGKRTRTAIGGCADLRNVYGASRSQTPFDELFHTADVRAGRGRTGWQNIPHLGVFVFRLRSTPVDGATPVADVHHAGEFTFDPTGREVPLYVGSAAAIGGQESADETQLPVPVDGPLFFGNAGRIYAAVDPVTQATSQNALRIYELDGAAASLVTVDRVTVTQRSDGSKYVIDPTRGRFRIPIGAHPKPNLVGYHYAFSSAIGAGAAATPTTPSAALEASPLFAISGGDDALFASAGLKTGGTITLGDSRTYREIPDVTLGTGNNALVVRAGSGCRPVLRPKHGHTWTWRITGAAGADGKGSELVLAGILVSGATIELAGDFDHVTLSACTLDPGGVGAFARAVDGQLLATAVRITGRVRRLTIEQSIVGTLHAGGASALVEETHITDTIAQSVREDDPVLSLGSGKTWIARSTLLGATDVQWLEATDSLLLGTVRVVDHRDGCVRYSAFLEGSSAPRPYECVVLGGSPRESPVLASTTFGRPTYGRLRVEGNPRIAMGSEAGSEMGAFCNEQAAMKERALLATCEEQMPIGLAPVLIYVT